MSSEIRARLCATGWDDDLTVEAQPVAADPTGDQVVVRVEACGVCHRDLIDRAGRFPFIQLPITPGHEAVGHVVAVGPEVTDWQVGDRVASMHRDYCGECSRCRAGATSLCTGAAHVLGLLIDGGYASLLVAPQRAFYRALPDLDAAQAAVWHCTLGTAFRGLRRYGQVEPGMRVLISGANGGVGAAALQVARAMGADVIGVIRSAEHAPLVESLGARVLIDDSGRFHKRIPGGPVDVVLDCVGTPTFNASLRALEIGGRLVAIGNVTAERTELNVGYIITRGLQITGSNGATRADMAELAELHGKTPLEVPIQARLPLSEADRGQRMVAAGGLRGRIVLEPPQA